MTNKRNKIIYSILHLFNKIVFGLVFFVYASYISLEKLGEWDIFITTTYVLIPIISLQLPFAFFRYTGEQQYRGTIDKIMNYSDKLLYIILIIVLYGYLNNKQMFFYIFPFAIIMINSLLYVEYFKGLNQILESSIIELMCITFPFLMGALTVYLGYVDLFYIVIILTSILLSLIIIFKYKKSLDSFAEIKYDKLKNMIVYSVALIPNGLSWLFLNSGYKYIIFNKLDEASLGLFSFNFRVAWIMPMLFTFIIVLVQQKALTEFRKNMNMGDIFIYNLVKLSFIYVFLSLIVFITVYMTRYEINVLNYIDLELLLILMVSSLLFIVSSLLGIMYIVHEKTYLSLYSILIASFVSIIGAYICIEDFGLIGVAYFFLIGSLLNVLIRIYHFRILEFKNV